MLLISFSVDAQDISHFKYNEAQGLPSREVYSVGVDSNGYLWAGTAFGLARFNGQKFENFTFEGQSGPSFSGISKDIFGRLWTHNFVGQLAVTIKNGVQQVLTYDESISIPYAYFTIIDGQFLFIKGKQGLYKATITPNVEDLVFELFVPNFEGTLSGWHPTYGLLSHDITSSYYGIDPITADKKSLFHSPKNISYRSGTASLGDSLLIFYNSSKEIFVKTALFESAQIDKKSTKIISTITANINKISQVGNDIWILTERGVYILDRSLKPKANAWPALNSFSCTDVARDLDGRFWVSTISDGVLMIPSFGFTSVSVSNSTLSDNRVQEIEILGNRLIAGSLNGNVQVLKLATLSPQNVLLSDDFPIQYLSTNPSQSVFAVVSNNHLKIYSESQKRLFGEPNNAVKSISWIDDNTLAVAATGVSKVISTRSNVPKWVSELPQDTLYQTPSSIRLYNGTATSILALSDREQIWLGTRTGLLILSKSGVDTLANPLTSRSIFPAVMQHFNDLIWIGTLSGELLIFDKNRNLRAFSSVNDGIDGSTIRSLNFTKEYFWIATNTGIQQLRLPISAWEGTQQLGKENWIYINENHGLISNEVTDLALKGTQLFVSSLKGIQKIDLNEMNHSVARPNIILNSIKVLDRPYSQQQLTLPYDSNRIELDISAVSLASGNQVGMEHRILGLDTNWVFQQKQQDQISFYQVPPGTYEFQARGVNRDGIRSEETIGVEITIRKPFWQTIWFTSILFFLLVSGVYVFIKRRIEAQQRSKTLADQLTINRLSALQAQMNPHFIYNALNSIQHFIFSNDKRASNRFLGKFADLMRLIMNHSAQESISLKEEIDTLKLYLDLEQMRLNNGFDYEFKIDDSLDPESIWIPPLVIQPFLENCIKHGFQGVSYQGRISIGVMKKSTSTLEFSIEDNGVGRSRSAKNNETKQHSSFSTGANQRRVGLLQQLHKTKLDIRIEDKTGENGKPLGTIVYLQLPILDLNTFFNE